MRICKPAVFAAMVVAGMTQGQAMADDRRGYAGIAFGYTKAYVDAAEVDSGLASLGLNARTSVDDTGTGIKIYGGYEMTRYFAFELGYTDLGKSTSYSTIPGGASVAGEWKAYSFDLSAVATMPLGRCFSVFGQAGGSIWALKFTANGIGPGRAASASDSETGVSPLLGIGATLRLPGTGALRAEFERRFSVGSDGSGSSNVDLITLGLQYHF